MSTPSWFNDPSLKRVEHFGKEKVSTNLPPDPLEVLKHEIRTKDNEMRFAGQRRNAELLAASKRRRKQAAEERGRAQNGEYPRNNKRTRRDTQSVTIGCEDNPIDPATKGRKRLLREATNRLKHPRKDQI